MRKFLILFMLAVAVSCASSCAKEKPKAPEQQTPVPVSTVTAAVTDVPETITSVGTVEAKNEAVVSAKVMGVIQKFWVDEGSRVGKGSVLLTIDDAEIRAKRNEAEQAKAAGVAALHEADAALKEASAALENANVNRERFENLYKEQAVTKKELDDINTQGRMAEAKVEQVEARIKQAGAKIAQADAAVSQANIMLGYTVLHSPISGVVTAKTANTGEMASPGRPLLKVVDDGELRLLATIKESDMAGMVKGNTVKVGFDALSGRKVDGKISEVIPAADPATRTFNVKIDLPRTTGILPGMFGRAYLPSGMRKAVLVPDASIVEREGVQGVFVVTPENTLRFQVVRLDEKNNGMTEVSSGLSGGETVVAVNPGSLKEGVKVVRK
jgi:membrane fusion protein, multidrug efflux system